MPPDHTGKLFGDHARELVRYARRLSGDADLAEDVVQEAFVRLMERSPEDRRNLRSWLFATVTNLVRDQGRNRRRSAKLRKLHGSLLTPGHGPQDPLRAAQNAELRARLSEALDTLSHRERVAILMREEGFAHREIAEALDTTTGTIGTLLSRALAKLARRLPLTREDT